MRLSNASCKIVGVRVGELSLDSLDPDRPQLKVNFVLLRDGESFSNSGKFTKTSGWSKEALQALHDFVEAIEEDALKDIFHLGEDNSEDVYPQENDNDNELSFPTLGGKKMSK